MVIANLASNKRSQFDISTGQFCLDYSVKSLTS
jgi:hypothetical protein